MPPDLRGVGQRIDRRGQQYDQPDSVLAGVTRAFEAVDADHVDALLHRRHRMAKRSALVVTVTSASLKRGR
jgi:hypothetical protein